jgi:hypothetical protein
MLLHISPEIIRAARFTCQAAPLSHGTETAHRLAFEDYAKQAKQIRGS